MAFNDFTDWRYFSLRIQQPCIWVYYNQQFYTLERKISNAEPFFCLSLKDLLKYWKVKKKSKNKDFNDGLIYVLPFFFCIKEKGSVSYEEADFCKKKIMRSGNFSTKAAIWYDRFFQNKRKSIGEILCKIQRVHI